MKIDSKQFSYMREAFKKEERLLMVQAIALCKLADLDVDKTFDTASNIIKRKDNAEAVSDTEES